MPGVLSAGTGCGENRPRADAWGYVEIVAARNQTMDSSTSTQIHPNPTSEIRHPSPAPYGLRRRNEAGDASSDPVEAPKVRVTSTMRFCSSTLREDRVLPKPSKSPCVRICSRK